MPVAAVYSAGCVGWRMYTGTAIEGQLLYVRTIPGIV